MSYAPNVECVERLARHVLPRVRAQRPGAHLAIVGRDPAPEVLDLDALDGVEVVGAVDDMRWWLARSAVWAGPFTIGTGIKTKLLEAMATDTPAVVTPVGGRGLDLDSGALLVGQEDDELAAHLVSVLPTPASPAISACAGSLRARPLRLARRGPCPRAGLRGGRRGAGAPVA